MASTIVRISQQSREILREMARRESAPMQSILDRALEAYRRQRFLEEANAAFAALKSKPQAWKQELEERKLWDHTLRDGLDR